VWFHCRRARSGGMRSGHPLRRGARLGCSALLVILLGIAWPSVGQADPATGLPVGKARGEVVLDGVRLAFHSYKPAIRAGAGVQSGAAGPLIVAFHGSDRQTELVRDFLIPLADREHAIIVAPLLDEERFPRWRYQWAGLLEPLLKDGKTIKVGRKTRHRLRDAQEWTAGIVLALVDHLRKREGRPDMPYYLVGHSAGAQFIGRLSAFTAHDARRIVLANPGSYLAPTRRRTFPYGFGGLPDDLNKDDALRRYLALPITIYVGTEDRRRKGLDKSPGAERQGKSRYERGREIFRLARETAASKGWPFGWRLVEAPGVGHNSQDMYGAPTALEALFGEAAPSGDQEVFR